MTWSTWLAFVTVTILLTASPGPSAALALHHGARYGFRRSAPVIAGSISAFMILMVFSLAGLGAFLSMSAGAFSLLKSAGALYLLYVGIQSWCSHAPAISRRGQSPATHADRAAMAYRRGFLVAASNPKVMIFFAALFPQFIDAAQPRLPQILTLALTFGVLETGWQLVYAACGTRLSSILDRPAPARWFRRLTGAVFVGTGLMVLSHER